MTIKMTTETPKDKQKVESSGTKATPGTSEDDGGGGTVGKEAVEQKRQNVETSPSPEEIRSKQTLWQKTHTQWVAINYYRPEMFVKSAWECTPGVSTYYLVYRWAMAVTFVCALFAVIMGWGRPRHYGVKWLIYLTHWGFTGCTVQAVLAAYLVTRARCRNDEVKMKAMKMNLLLCLYSFLRTITTSGAFLISTMYWGYIYNPVDETLNPVNLVLHCGNSILMMTDLIVVASPIRLIDFYYNLVFEIIYPIFNYLYYLAGGTDPEGNPYVYQLIDWRKPARAIAAVIGCAILNIFIHVVVSFISLLKLKIANILRSKKAGKEDQTRGSNEKEQHV